MFSPTPACNFRLPFGRPNDQDHTVALGGQLASTGLLEHKCCEIVTVHLVPDKPTKWQWVASLHRVHVPATGMVHAPAGGGGTGRDRCGRVPRPTPTGAH